MSVKRYFVPMLDITTYELAVIVAKAGGVGTNMANGGVLFDDDAWDSLPPAIKRHFSDKPARSTE